MHPSNSWLRNAPSSLFKLVHIIFELAYIVNTFLRYKLILNNSLILEWVSFRITFGTHSQASLKYSFEQSIPGCRRRNES